VLGGHHLLLEILGVVQAVEHVGTLDGAGREHFQAAEVEDPSEPADPEACIVDLLE